MVRKFLSIIIFLGIFQLSYAQEVDCGASLDLAKSEFAAGHLNVIDSILSNCLKKGFTDEQKIDAYRLLTVTNLYLDDYPKAEESFTSLLNIDYEYQVLKTDPVELEFLSKKFITTPIVSYYARLGANLTTVTVLNRYTSSSNLVDNAWVYKPGFGFNIVGGLELHFSKALSLNFEADLNFRTFNYLDSIFPPEPQVLEQFQTNLHASLPILFKYTIANDLTGKRKGEKRLYYPYFYAGYSPSYTLTSTIKDKRNPLASEPLEGSTINYLGKTSSFSHSLIFGLGLKRRIKFSYVLVDFRYRLGMSNMLDTKNRYNYNDLSIKREKFDFVMPDDDYLTNGFELTLGYVWPQYKVREKNSVTIQTVFKNMFNKKPKQDE